MHSPDTLQTLIRDAADHNYRHRLAAGLLKALGRRAGNSDLCIPLSQPIDDGNLAAVNAWLVENPPEPEGDAHQSALSKLQRCLTLWELDQWD